MFRNYGKSNVSFKDIPNECILYLFNNYLNFNCKLEAEKVCKLWRVLVALSYRSTKTVIISDFELYYNRINSLNLSNKRLSFVKVVSNHLRERTETKDKNFISIVLRKYKNLETVCICLKQTKGNHNLLGLVSKFCGKELKNLRIELSECLANNKTLIISQEEVLQISENCPKLQYFYVDFVNLFISEQCLHSMFTKWPNIESIVLHKPCFRGYVYNSELENSLNPEFSGDHFSLLPMSVTRLEVTGNILNSNAIHRIPENTNIKRLLISKAKNNSIETICQKFSSLTFFGISMETNVNEEDMYFLMESIGKLHHLEELYIALIGVPINQNCIKLLRTCNRLKSLRIDQTLISKDAIDAIPKYFPAIQDLQIGTSGLNQNFHYFLSDSVVTNVQKLKILRKMSLRGQRNISDKSLSNIIANCHLLESIDVRTTKAALITFSVCVQRGLQSDTTIEVFINETPICRLFSPEYKRYKFCKNLIFNNEEYDFKIHF